LFGGIAVCAGFIMAIEMTRSLLEGMGAPVGVSFGSVGTGFELDPHQATYWIFAALLFGAGVGIICKRHKKRN
jgi:branched-chain amino acid transport system permease protein